MQPAPFAPLILARVFGVPQEEVAFRLRVTTDWLRKMARDPRHEQRVRIAELEVILAQERAKAAMTSGACAAQAAEPRHTNAPAQG